MKAFVAILFSAALFLAAAPIASAHCGGCGVDCATECSKKDVKDQKGCMDKCKKDHPKDTSTLPEKATPKKADK